VGSTLVWVFALLASLELSFRISWLTLAGKGLKATGKQIKKLPKPELSKLKPRLALPSGGANRAGKHGLSGRASERDKQGPILDIMVDPEPKKPTSASKPESFIDRFLDKAGKEENRKNSKTQEKEGQLALPPYTLLSPIPVPKPGDDPKPEQAALEAKGTDLMACLQNFGVQAKLAKITPGPVVTMFEVRPDPGVKASRIASLAPDLAMSLKAVAVRIQAPIPGTDTVGVEIPNEKRASVTFREIVETETFRNSSSLLTIALGKDIGGRSVAADLARMPHLLVAGATGAGKSVCLNSIILSLLYKARPDEVQMLLVDPKRVELAMYADLPHLVHPVVTEMDLAKNALLWAIEEMDRRYELFRQIGVRNITGYNEKTAKLPDPCPEEMEGLEWMPFLVIIVDELADLMLTRGKDVESSLVRLAQLARAAGIHLIIATLRPSVDVVTGLIKANFPCRIAFQVTSHHDSRTILDGIGAEALLGKGDMLFKPSGGKLQRLHGAFVSDEEVGAVVDYWKKQGKPSYKIDFSAYGEEEGSDPLQGESGAKNDVLDDPIYAEAVQFVRDQGRVSISLLQRRFRVGFNRAARYVEQMERDGVVSPGNGAKPRNVVK
jgi:S-DNA-T family DNA segregation ATPase FtsK/SpoIIIE